MYGYGWGFWVQEIWFEAALLGSHGFQALLISHKKLAKLDQGVDSLVG